MKQAAFHALAEFYQSVHAQKSKSYGEQIARLKVHIAVMCLPYVLPVFKGFWAHLSFCEHPPRMAISGALNLSASISSGFNPCSVIRKASRVMLVGGQVFFLWVVGGGKRCRGTPPLAGQIISKSCRFSPVYTPNFGLKIRNFLRFAPLFVKTLLIRTPFSKVCVWACWDLPFSPHLTIGLSRKEWNNGKGQSLKNIKHRKKKNCCSFIQQKGKKKTTTEF